MNHNDVADYLIEGDRLHMVPWTFAEQAWNMTIGLSAFVGMLFCLWIIVMMFQTPRRAFIRYWNALGDPARFPISAKWM